MANKPTWKSRDIINPFVENQGSNRKLHTIRKLGPTRDAPNLKLGFTTKGGYEYGQTAGLKLWIQAQKSGVPTDQKAYHTIKVTTGSAGHNGIAGASGSLLTTKEDTPFIRFTPKPYRSLSRAIVINSGSADRHFLHVASSQYVTLASGSEGTKNKSMSWNLWIKPQLLGNGTVKFTVDRYGSISGFALKLTDSDSNVYSASIGSSVTIANSTAKVIGVSDVSSTANLSEAIYNSITQAKTYGIDSSTTDSAAGRLLQFDISRTLTKLFITASKGGKINQSTQIEGNLVQGARPAMSLTSSNGVPRYIFSKASGSVSAGKQEYALKLTQHAGLQFSLWDESTDKVVTKYTDLTTSGSAIQRGVWQNICVTFASKTGEYTHQGIKMYRNGLLIASGNAGTTQSGYVATENAGGDLCFGIPYTGSSIAGQFYRGKMAEMSMWHVALEATEVKALYDARRFFGRMDTSATDHLRQGVSILTNKQRWRSSNAPKISGISRLSQDERVSHEQDQTEYGQGKTFRDDTPFEEMADAGRLRRQIDRTIVGSKASASIAFRGYQPATGSSTIGVGLVLTGSGDAVQVFYFHSDGFSSRTEFTAAEYAPVTVTNANLDLATGSFGQGVLWASAFTSAVNDKTSTLKIQARRFGNIVKLVQTAIGTAGNTYITPRLLKASHTATTGSSTSFQHVNNDGKPVIFGFITGTYNTSSIGKVPGNLGVLSFIGGNSTMKHVVTQALGGAIDYLRDPGKQQYPVIITNVSMRDPSQFDGNIEPLIIRDSVSHTSIDAPFVAHDVRGTFMGGEGNILFGSSQIEQFYDNKNPVSSDTQVKSAPAGARRFSAETIPFFDAQDVVFALPAKPSYAYLRFACVPNNHDKIVMTDASGQQVCFEFVNSTNLSTRSFGKLRNRPHKSGGVAGSSGRGTWRVLLTGSSNSAPGTGASLTTGSQTTSAVAAAMSLFRNELGLAQTHRRLMLTCSNRRLTETYTSIVDEETTTHVVSAAPALPGTLVPNGIAGTIYTYSTAVGKRTYVRLDQLASGSDGNRVIDFRFRGASSGTYIVNGVTASNAYQAIITAYSGALGYQNRRTRIKFIRNLAYRKYGMGFLSGSNMFILPMDGFIAEITRKITPFSDNKMMAVRRIKDGLNVGPATLLTSTLGGIKEWNELGHGYKSSGTGFTYNNDMFGTDSIAFGGRKR